MIQLRPSSPSALLASLALLAPGLAGCNVGFGSATFAKDGVELPHKHVETVEVSSLEQGFEVAAAVGVVLIEHVESGTTLTVEVLEHAPGDASAAFEDGAVVTRTVSGKPSAIGTVRLRTDQPLSRLAARSGRGDVEVIGLELSGEVLLESGMGDCRLAAEGRQESVSLRSGKGDLTVRGVACTSLVAKSGMGDVELLDVEATDGTFHTGLGDVELEGCTFGSLEAKTGLGDVELENTTYDTEELSAGLGRVTRG